MKLNKKNYLIINLIVITIFSALFILYYINFSKIKVDNNLSKESYTIQKSDEGFLIQIGGLNLGKYAFNPLKSIDAVIDSNWISYMGSKIEQDLFYSGPCYFKARKINTLKMFVVNSFDQNASAIKLIFDYNDNQVDQVELCKNNIKKLINQVNQNIIDIINKDIESIVYKQIQEGIIKQSPGNSFDSTSIEFTLKQIEDDLEMSSLLTTDAKKRKDLESQLTTIQDKLDEISKEKKLGILLLEKIKLEKEKYVDLEVYELRRIFTPEPAEKNFILLPMVLFFVIILLVLTVINLIYFKKISIKKIFRF